MPERTIKKQVQDPDNPNETVTGTVVKILNAEEPISYAELEDGTRLTLKVSFIEAVRIDDRWDRNGKPIYTITQNATLMVDPDLKVARGRSNNG